LVFSSFRFEIVFI